MNPLVSLDGLFGWVAVATPIVVLAIIAATTLWAQRPRRGDTPIAFDSREAREDGAAWLPLPTEPETALLADGEGVAVRADTSAPTLAGAMPVRGRGSGEAGADELEARDERAAIAAAIADAEGADAKSGGERGRLAELYLALAVLEREAGDEAAAAPLLRKSIVLASETGNAAVHAKARLELGDQAQVAGDLITACEHWQMARALFDQTELLAMKAEAEARMQRNGCPTDWVLTDF